MSNINTFLIGNNIKCSQSKPRLRLIGHSVIPLLGETSAEILCFEVRLDSMEGPCPTDPASPKRCDFQT